MIERQITDQIIEIEQLRIKNPELVKKVLAGAINSFKSIPVDCAHNFDNHGLPTVLNVLTINEYRLARNRKDEIASEDIDLDAVICAAAIHDRQRTVFGHIPGNFLARQILTSAGADPSFQDKVLSLIKHHSEIENIDVSTEQKILNTADKLEYLSRDRAEEALNKLPKFMIKRYKEYWSGRIEKVRNLIQDLSDELGIDEFYNSNLNRCLAFVKKVQPDLVEVFDGLEI